MDNTSTPAQADLPSVLIIGDSISIGYTPFVREILSGKAAVWRPVRPDGGIINCGSTAAGVSELKQWLGNGRYDLITFNFGLHDIAYRHPDSPEQGHRDKVRGTLSVAPDAYRKNMETITRMLKETGARLIWVNTTLVPPGEIGRFEGDEVRFNRIAQDIMEREGIPVCDLHALTAAFDAAMFAGPGNVHYTKEGSCRLAEKVAEVIIRTLPCR